MTIAHFTPQLTRSLFDNGSVTVTTNKQRAVMIRPGAALDAALVSQMYRGLSERSLRLRYGAPWQQLPEELIRDEMARMLDGDPRLTATLIGTIGAGPASSAVSVAELVQSPSDRTTAEVALLVRDDYQREGLGRMLGRMIHEVALARGVRLLRIYLQVENVAIMRLIRSLGTRYSAETRRGETTVLIPVEDD
jgi:GNAT superfamily N-acetyltransferase